jgi:hypothetical protein
MSTITPIAYNNTGIPISGTSQLGDLSIGDTSQDYGAFPDGYRFWATPDEDLYYVVAYPVPAGNHPNPLSIPCYVGFFKTPTKTDSDFLNLANYIAIQNGTPQNFTSGNDAKVWLNNNGYWTSYTPAPTNTPTNTPSVTPSVTTTQTPTPTPTQTPTPSTTPSIVDNGLIIQLDADNISSYPGTGTSVFNLESGSYTHTLTNAPYTILNGVKCFDCNGLNTTINVPNNTGPTLPTTGYTYITWARIKTSSSTYRTLFRTLPDDHPILVEINTDNLGFWDNATSSFTDSGYDVTSIEDVWVQYAVVGDDSSSIFYINGTQVGTVARGAGGNTHWAWGSIVGQPFGYVANMYYYNRKLLLSEITQNYNFLASRFI